MPAADQGETKDRYTLIPRSLIIITRQDEVLLIKGAPHKRLWSNKYNGIGGHIEQGENVYASAIREIKEETGLAVQDIALRGVITIDTGSRTGICIFVMKATVYPGRLTPSNEGSLEWVPIDSINNLPLVEDLPVLIPIILSPNLDEPPFAANYHYNEMDELIIQFFHE